MKITYHTPSAQTVVTYAVGLVKGDTGSLLPEQAALVSDAIAARDAVIGYETRAEAAAANVPPVVKTLRIGALSYRRDPAGTALTTADGATWSPADPVPTVKHYAQPLNLNNDDAPAVNALIAEAEARDDREVHINSPVRAMTPIELSGKITHRFGGPITWAGGAGPIVTQRDRGGYEEYGTVNGLDIMGNGSADIGLLLDHARYWKFNDLKIGGLTKEGSWGLVSAGTADNRNASLNRYSNFVFMGVDNGIFLGKNPTIVGSANTGSSFNLFEGGRIGNIGRNNREYQVGIKTETGEANHFQQVRVSASYDWTKCWDMNDARTHMIHCAGDGPSNSVFVYFAAGTSGTINTITVMGEPMLTTPVAWQGSRDATALAVVAQIELDGNQYPATAYRAIAYGPQVIFYTVDANDFEVRISDLTAITTTKTGDIVFGTSAVGSGSLQATPFSLYEDINKNKWGHWTGRGGNRHIYGFWLGQGFSGSLYEPDGNGPEHVIWFENVGTQRKTNIQIAGGTVFAAEPLNTDAATIAVHGQIRAIWENPDADDTISHTAQNMWLINDGAFVNAFFDLQFVPTFAGPVRQFAVELPQKPGVRHTTQTLNELGLRVRFPVDATGLNTAAVAGKQIVAVHMGSTLSANGNPQLKLYLSDGGTLTSLNTSHFTSGTAVRIRGQGRWPAERFQD